MPKKYLEKRQLLPGTSGDGADESVESEPNRISAWCMTSDKSLRVCHYTRIVLHTCSPIWFIDDIKILIVTALIFTFALYDESNHWCHKQTQTELNSECDLVCRVHTEPNPLFCSLKPAHCQWTVGPSQDSTGWWVYSETGQDRPLTHPSSLPMATTFPSGFQLRSVCGDSLCCWESRAHLHNLFKSPPFTFCSKHENEQWQPAAPAIISAPLQLWHWSLSTSGLVLHLEVWLLPVH